VTRSSCLQALALLGQGLLAEGQRLFLAIEQIFALGQPALGLAHLVAGRGDFLFKLFFPFDRRLLGIDPHLLGRDSRVALGARDQLLGVGFRVPDRLARDHPDQPVTDRQADHQRRPRQPERRRIKRGENQM